MKTSLDCLPCFLRQALTAARFITEDPAVHERILRQVLRSTAEMDLNQSPPVVARIFYRRLGEMSGMKDIYRPAKDRFNELAKSLAPELRETINQHPDPLLSAARLAIAGNIIDFGIDGGITEEELHVAVAKAFEVPLEGKIEEFREAITRAQSILY